LGGGDEERKEKGAIPEAEKIRRRAVKEMGEKGKKEIYEGLGVQVQVRRKQMRGRRVKKSGKK
jgi:hypothetical protein